MPSATTDMTSCRVGSIVPAPTGRLGTGSRHAVEVPPLAFHPSSPLFWFEEDADRGRRRHEPTRVWGAGLRGDALSRRRGGRVLHLRRTKAGGGARRAAGRPRDGPRGGSGGRGEPCPGHARAIPAAARSRAQGGPLAAIVAIGVRRDAQPPARPPSAAAREAQAQDPRPGPALPGPRLRADGDGPPAERAVPLLRGEEARGRAARTAGRDRPGPRPSDAVCRPRLRHAGEALLHRLLRVLRREPGGEAQAPEAPHGVPAPGLRGADLAVVEVRALPPPRAQGAARGDDARAVKRAHGPRPPSRPRSPSPRRPPPDPHDGGREVEPAGAPPSREVAQQPARIAHGRPGVLAVGVHDDQRHQGV